VGSRAPGFAADFKGMLFGVILGSFLCFSGLLQCTLGGGQNCQANPDEHARARLNDYIIISYGHAWVGG
jgi:hypothetical protein